MPNGNFGSFGGGLGGSDAIRAALDRRSSGSGSVPALSQVSGGAPGAGAIPPTPPAAVPQQGGLPGGGQGGVPVSEAEMIIKALSSHLRKIGDATLPPKQPTGGVGI